MSTRRGGQRGQTASPAVRGGGRGRGHGRGGRGEAKVTDYLTAAPGLQQKAGDKRSREGDQVTKAESDSTHGAVARTPNHGYDEIIQSCTDLISQVQNAGTGKADVSEANIQSLHDATSKLVDVMTHNTALLHIKVSIKYSTS